MRQEFVFKIAGEPVLMSFAELDLAMRHQFDYEVRHIENRIVEIFDVRKLTNTGSYTSIGKMKTGDAVIKFR